MQNQKGFTLIELLIVIAVLAILGIKVAQHMGYLPRY
jgi:prepilin-type N-terminal cleavage/methylation domain-containing protein